MNQSSFLRSLTVATLLAASSFAVDRDAYAFDAARKANAVAELFTSQGCSSCPPADALWKELAKRDDVLMLTLPIDYWDHLGWRDTMARPEHTARQKAYAAGERRGRIFTPEALINGRHSVVGSDRRAVIRTLDAATRETRDLLRVKSTDGGVTVQVADINEPVTLWMVVYRKQTEISVARGENGGRTLAYVNVVERMDPVDGLAGTVVAGGTDLTLPSDRIALEKDQNCALILQKGTPQDPGPMLSAVVLNPS
ncbi:MAG: DUF1223 domain-containing protein [Pseudomonadota bacterium]